MARLLVGLPALVGDIKKYKERFDMVELRPVDTAMPKLATLRAWRRSVPPGFVFSVVLPRAVGELAPGAAFDAALAQALEVATAVEARCLVVATPPSVRPTQTNRKRLAALLERLPREGVVVAWEAAGLWETEDLWSTARAAGVVPVLDAAREVLPPGPIAYTRLRALGKGAAIGAATVDRVADRLRGRREAFVVVEGAPDAARVKAGLKAALSRKAVAGGAMLVRPPAPRPRRPPAARVGARAPGGRAARPARPRGPRPRPRAPPAWPKRPARPSRPAAARSTPSSPDSSPQPAATLACCSRPPSRSSLERGSARAPSTGDRSSRAGARPGRAATSTRRRSRRRRAPARPARWR